MSSRTRKAECHTRRKQRHEAKRAAKRESARSHSKQTPRSERNSYNTFPAWLAKSGTRNMAWWTQWGTPVKQWTRSKAA